MTGPRSLISRYALVLAAVGLATLLRAAFEPWLLDRSPLLPHLIFFLLLSAGIVCGVHVHFSNRQRDEAARRDLGEREEQLRTVIEELRGAKEQAEAASLAKEHFLAVLSHELRRPLTPVLMLAESMESHPEIPENFRRDAAMIRRHVSLEARLIDDLLDLTRIEKGTLSLERHAVNVHDILCSVVEMLRPEAREKGVGISTNLHAGQPYTQADHSRIKQVILNLLGNALKFTPPGGSVAVKAENAGDFVQVTVNDTGIGIPREALPTIFDAFEQTDIDLRRFGGLGLGLAIAKSLVELHGGEIRASSPGLGRGSIFTFTLPAIGGALQSHPGESTPQEIDAGRLRILLVEDHEPTAFVLGRLLKRRGHEVKVAMSVSEAVSCDGLAIDLLVSDIGLPDGSGIDVIRHFRSSQNRFHAIALSGFGMEGDIGHSLNAGFDRHLIKPVDFGTLEATIAELFEPEES